MFEPATKGDWLEGRVVRRLWAADDGGWAVLKVRTADAGEVVVVGALGHLADLVDEQPFASFEGEHMRHPTHGWQFKATGVVVGSPRTEAGLKLYLGSSVPGIGEKVAARIVRHFGAETTHVLEHDPKRLTEIPGVGEKRAEAIAEAWAADAGNRALSILLRGLGVSLRMVQRIRERYGDEAWKVVTTEPYRLAEEVRGIGFGIADRVARNQGLPADHPDRVAAAVRHVVQRASDEGHCLLPVPRVADAVGRLDVPVDDLQTVLDRLVGEGRLVDVGEGERAVATPKLAAAEERVSWRLAERAVGPSTEDVDDLLAAAERWAGVSLDASQQEAVRTAATGAVTVITGGPGTGKTTLVRVLLRVAEERGEQWALASPTGRAAKRLAEATGREASTLHRLLAFQPGTGRFGHDASEPLDVDALVVDEFSMVDIQLIDAVLEALPAHRRCRLVLVGDADQLPSVGPGQVLRDVIDSGVVPVRRLGTVHRQDDRSGIVTAAAAIHGGTVPPSGERAGVDDFFLVPRDDPDAARDTIVQIVKERMPAVGFDPMEDVQVLAPTRRGPLGVQALNEALREALNPHASRIQVGGRAFGAGDRVICTRNRYDHGVFNGDLGRVVEARKDGLTIRFDEGTVAWARDELDQIDLAYAVTVHKSQGSEYPAVVLALHRAHGIMLRRNLFYTAVTRAQRFFCGVGDPGAWARAVREQRGDARHTRLARLLRRDAELASSPGMDPGPIGGY